MLEALGAIDQQIDRLADQAAGGLQGGREGVPWIYSKLDDQLLNGELAILCFSKTGEGFARLAQRLGQLLAGALWGVDEQAAVGLLKVLDERGDHRLIPRSCCWVCSGSGSGSCSTT